MSNLVSRSREELKRELALKQEDLRKFRFGVSGSSHRNMREGRMLRKDIARIFTALNSA